MPQLEVVDELVRVAAAAGLTGLVGLERQLDAQPAGLRTHTIVGIGAAVFTVVGVAAVGGNDPTRIAAQVVTGIGFLGAGAILRDGLHISGLTTAATLWISAAIGTACGLGIWAAALAGVGGALVALRVLRVFERRALPRRGIAELSVEVGGGTSLEEVLRAVEAIAGGIAVREVVSSGPTERVLGTVRLTGRRPPLALVDEVLRIDGVTGVDLRA